ncbi:MAG: cupin domain-containing protein [Chloroflexi bacterium]|nr:cupin domain-containing protein [Chloroflexota bacterium]MCI0854469.1 cupin domain-containing protein [Chloroflexota bacterium]
MAFVSLDELEAVEPVPGYVATFVHTKQMTLANWKITAGSSFPEHSHPHEQIMMVLEGEFELTVAGKSMLVRPGVVAVIPADAKHSGRAVTDCIAIDVFYPVREDYRWAE